MDWLHQPCCRGDQERPIKGGKIRSGPHVGGLATSVVQHGGGQRFKEGDRIRSGPHVGGLATSPRPYRGSPMLHSGGQNGRWPTCGRIGYITHDVGGIPNTPERGIKSEVAHMWADWLHQPCRMRGPQCSIAGDKIRSCAHVGGLATPPLPHRGCAMLHSGGENRKWPTCGRTGCITPAYRGSPMLHSGGTKSEVAHMWADWLHLPCRIGGPQCSIAGDKIRCGPHVGGWTSSPLLYRGSPMLHSGGENRKWPTCGRIAYMTPAVWGVPNAP